LYALLEALEGSDAPVLIEGETGTGKELVARALHEKGLRAGKPFQVIDCGNLPAQLMESELFGYKKGAFTGANADKAGIFEAADGGTVFLDEFDELALEIQPKLLRVLETSQVRRLGDTDFSPVDVRIITATKRDLAAEVAGGRFRQDLFYRVAVVRLRLPPLRERIEDIPLLANHLAAQMSDGKVTVLATEVLESFMQSEWPGNVRELRNAVQRTLALGKTGTGTEPTSTPPAPAAGNQEVLPAPAEYRAARDQAMRSFDMNYLMDLWSRHEGNLSAAAREAGISRVYLRDLLKKYGLY
jgi:DNA-binding NtrC family response regulator